MTATCESRLLARTRELLSECEVPVIQIHHDTGLSYHWLNQMKYSSKQVDPSVSKIEKLYEYLSGKQLEV
jgi:hypothetical protein